MNRPGRVLLVVLIAPLLALHGSVLDVNWTQIFPNLWYAPDAWTLVRLTNPSSLPKTARVEVYRSDGSPIQSEHIVTLTPSRSIEIRIEERTTENKFCWARVEDISKDKSGQPLEASALVEHVTGDTLEDFPRDAFLPERTGKWLSPAKGVSNKRLFFLNVSDRPTVLEICSVNTRLTCSAEDAKPLRTAVKPRQAVVLKIGNLQRRTLSIRSTPAVMSIIGLLQPEIPTTREYSSESSISFDEPAQK